MPSMRHVSSGRLTKHDLIVLSAGSDAPAVSCSVTSASRSTATAIVAVMIFHATVSQDSAGPGPSSGPPDPVNARVSEILLLI